MTWCKVILVLLCLIATRLPQHAQENFVSTSCIPVKTVSDSLSAYAHSEEVVYTLHYEWGMIDSDVAKATVRLDSLTYNGERAYKCTMLGSTTRLYDIVFKVREDFQAWFTRDGIRPLKYYRHSYEGDYEAENLYVYDRKAAEPVIRAELFTSKLGSSSFDIPLTPCTFDLPTLFYYARNMDIDAVEPGVKYPMTFAVDDEVINAYFILHGREEVNIKKLGKIKTIKFGAKLLEGEVFKGDSDMLIWVTDDDNRLPVYFEAPLLIGTAIGRIKSYKNLKHPFTSLVK